MSKFSPRDLSAVSRPTEHSLTPAALHACKLVSFCCWMPTSPSSCHDEQETAHSSNSTVASPPLSTQTRSVLVETRRHDDDPNAMMLVMASGGDGRTRLEESRSRDDRRTEEPKNDDHITSKIITTAVGVNERTICGGGNASLLALPVTTKASESAASSRQTTSLLPTLSSQATSTTHQEDQEGKRSLSSELVQKAIQSAVSSMGQRPSDLLESSSHDPNTDDEEEDEDEDDVRNPTSKMSVDKLVPCKKPRRKRTPQIKSGQTAGRWTQQEHQAFLEGLKECGREWKKVAMKIPTRTSAQIRSHAQKYFSKIQRDHESALLPDGPALSAGASVGGCATSAIPTGDGRSLTPSVRQNVERIMANPSAAQQEVESTLEALRERYRQLQLRLEQRQEQRRARHTDRSYRVPDEDLQGSNQFFSSPRKRNLSDVVPSFSSSNGHHDDHSSVSSNISASVASMGNDELIALHVLGGALPRGESNQDLERMVVHASHSSDVSVASSAASAHNDEAQGSEPAENHSSNNNFSPSNEDPTPKRPRSN